MNSFLYSLHGSGSHDFSHHHSILHSIRGGVGKRYRIHDTRGYPINDPYLDRVYDCHGHIHSDAVQSVHIPSDLRVVFFSDPDKDSTLFIPTRSQLQYGTLTHLLTKRPDAYNRWVLEPGTHYFMRDLRLTFRSSDDNEMLSLGVWSYSKPRGPPFRSDNWTHHSIPVEDSIPFNVFLQQEIAFDHPNNHAYHPLKPYERYVPGHLRTWYFLNCASVDDPDIAEEWQLFEPDEYPPEVIDVYDSDETVPNG